MAEIPVEHKHRGIPFWVWLAGGLLAALLLFLFLRSRHEHDRVSTTTETSAVTPAPASQTTLTSSHSCTDDNACSGTDVCINGACTAVTANTSACAAPTMHFATSSATPTDADRAALDRVARCLRADQKMKLDVMGDADQRGTPKQNQELGEKRARAIAAELTNRGVSPAQLHVVSYGKNKLLCAENDEACWAKNRRVDTQVHPE